MTMHRISAKTAFKSRPFAYVFSRMVKIFANVMKQFFRLHFWMFPDKRFEIPSYSPPIWRSKKAVGIPRTVWQTNYSDKVTLAVYFANRFNRLLAPTFEFCFINDDEQIAFIAENYPEEVNAAFTRLQIGAAKADYWRVLTLIKKGGVYLDIDANLASPLEWTLRDNSSELFIIDRKGLITNSFLATVPENPIFHRIADQIRQNIADPKQSDVFHMTGPGAVWQVLEDCSYNSCSYRSVSHQGQFNNPTLQYPDKGRGKWWQEQNERDIRK